MEHDQRLTLQRTLEALRLPATVWSPLESYAHAVARDADRLGLVSVEGVRHFLSRHVAESLAFALARAPQPGEVWADVGSGAGLPGIPLAIAFPATRFALIEPQQRRAGFLELVAEDLGLANVTVHADRVQKFVGPVEVAVTRAFSSDAASGASLATFELLHTVLRPGGEAVIQAADGADPPAGAHAREISPSDAGVRAKFLIMRADKID